MKTTNKVSSFIGGLVIAFAITLFLPTAASATWGNYNHGSKNHDSSCNTNSHGSKNHGSHGSKKHGSHGSKKHGSHGSKAHGSHGSKKHCNVDCSKYEKLANKYQKLSEKYLNKYNATHCYTFYKKYLCFAKKAEYFKNKFDQCQANSTVDCDKYKVIADKYKACAVRYKRYADYYHNLYVRCGWYCYEYYSKCYMNKYNYFMNLYNQYMDKYNNCQAENIYGKVFGYVYEDANGNKQKDAGEVGKAGIVVSITDVNGDTQTATTDATGKYTFDRVINGKATITVTQDGLPTDATLYTDTNPSDFDILAGKNNNVGNDGYTLPAPLDTDGDGVPDVTDLDDDNDGILDVDEGNGLVDTDGDGIVDSLDLDSDNDTIPDNVEAQSTDGYAAPTGIDTDNDGLDDAYDVDNGGTPVTNPDTDNDGIVDALDLDSDNDGINDIIEVGQPDTDNDGMTDNSVGNNGLDDTVEAEDTYADTNGNIDNPSTLPNTQNPDTDEVDYRDASLPITVGTACGSVIVDGEGALNVTVNVLDADGVNHPEVTDADGKYCAENLPLGEATIKVDISTLPFGVEQVLGEDPNTITVEAKPDNDAGIDGFEVIYGKTCGLVKIDTNENNVHDSVDTGIKDVTVTVTDAAGIVRIRTTDSNGKWCVNALSAGLAKVDIDESTLPDDAVQVYGIDPEYITIIAGQYSSGKADGYVIQPELVCPTGFEALQMTIFTSGTNTSDNLQTTLPITLLNGASNIIFKNVQTSDKQDNIQPNEQFKIVAVDGNNNLLAETGYTTDINNVTHEDEFSDLGTLSLTGASEILLVHRADPVYGDNLPDGNSVTFRGLCYKFSSYNP